MTTRKYRYDYEFTIRATSKGIADSFWKALMEVGQLYNTAELQALVASEKARRANAEARQQSKPPPQAPPPKPRTRPKASKAAPPPPPKPPPPNPLPNIPWGQGAPWWQILGLTGPHVTEATIKSQYRKYAALIHPDKPGGSTVKMQELNGALAKAKKERGIK